MKNTKKIFMISLIMFIIGAIMVVSGFLLGGAKPIVLGSNGFKVYNNKDILKVNDALSSFKDIDITAHIADINIIPSDKFSIDMECAQSTAPIEYSVQNDKLVISQNNTTSGVNINLGLFNYKNNYINIYVPSDATFDSIILKSNSGDLNIKDIKANEININCSYGDITIDNVEANTFKSNMNSGDLNISNLTVKKNSTIDNQYGDIKIKSSSLNTLTTNLNSGNVKINESKIESTTINNKYGDVEIRKLGSKGINISNNSGDVDISGELNGTTTINSLYGDVDITTSLSEDHYSYSAVTKYGDVRVNNTSYESNISKTNNGNNKIDAKAQSGDIDIFFNK